MDRRTFCASALAALFAATGVNAHPDHRDGDLFIDVLVSQEADRVDVIMRTPLDLLSGVGLPLTGASYVDAIAFREPDPVVGDGRTYEERAVSAVRSAFRLEQDGAAIPLIVRSARLAPGDGTADFDARRLTAEGEALDTKPLIDAHHGFLDIHFTGDVEGGPMVFVPALGAGAGSTVTFRIAADESEEPVTVSGGGEPVQLTASDSRPTSP